jgi:hypothetical protein
MSSLSSATPCGLSSGFALDSFAITKRKSPFLTTAVARNGLEIEELVVSSASLRASQGALKRRFHYNELVPPQQSTVDFDRTLKDARDFQPR